MAAADLTHIDTWLFDLDNTLYPAGCQLFALVETRMTDFVAREAKLPREAAFELQHRYFREHGTTLAGLMANHGVDPVAFIAEVEDVGMDCLTPDPVLRAAIGRLPGRRLVFTNAGGRYAGEALERLELADLFEDVFHCELADYTPKPRMETFERLIARHDLTPVSTCFFEDVERNLAPGAELGMTTVLVGAHAAASTAAFVHHRTLALAPFLASAKLKETP